MPERSTRLPGLRSARAERGWSQDRLHRESGVSRDNISRLETDEQGAFPVTVHRLARALGVPPSRLLRDTDAEGPTENDMGAV